MVGNVAVEQRKKIKKQFDRLMTNGNHVVFYRTEFSKTISHILEELDVLDDNLCHKGIRMMMFGIKSFSAERTADILRLKVLWDSPRYLRWRVVKAHDEKDAKLEGLHVVSNQLPTLEEFYAMKVMDRIQLNAKWRSARLYLESKKTLFEGLHYEWAATKEKILGESKAILSKYFSHEIILLEENPGNNAQGGQD